MWTLQGGQRRGRGGERRVEGGGEGEGRLDTPDQGLSVISCSKYKDTAELGTCSFLFNFFHKEKCCFFYIFSSLK